MVTNFNIKSFIDTIDGREFKKQDPGYRARFWSVRSKDLSTWYILQAHRDRKNRDILFDVMHDVNIAKDIIKVVNEGQDNGNGFPLEFVAVLTNLIDVQTRKLERDEILESYEKCVAKIIKPFAKELRKETGITKELAFELLGVLPTPSIINKYNISVYTYRINRKLYTFEFGEDVPPLRLKQVRKIYQYLFGEEFSESKVALTILLENRSDDFPTLDVYSLLTVYALDTLEALPKDKLRESIKEYGERRSKERDMERRIRLDAISKSDYPRITKAIKKVSKQNDGIADKFS